MAVLTLENLPPEIISTVCSHLPNRDIKNLRLTNRGVCSTARLRLDRVFLSPNPCNIDVLKAVADHPVFSKAIAEIIWDDARLVNGPQGGDSDDEDNEWDGGSEPEDDPPEGCPAWYARACRDNNEWIEIRVGDDIPRPSQVSRMRQVEEQMPLNLAWEYYEQLLLQQEEILQSEADIKALHYGLERFPSLKRITITPAVHGLLYEPAYETPMIRSFPYGFNYPIPRTWPLGDYGGPVGGDPFELPPWNETDQSPYWGFNCVLRELATNEHHVSEFVIDVCTLRTGINYRIFDDPSCVQYQQLTKLLRRPGFRRLDLHLNADGDYWRNWTCLRDGHLHRALSEAKDLRHFTFGAFHDDMQYDQCVDRGTPESRAVFTPLRTFLPLDRWERLQHLGLSNLLVRQDDLLSAVNELPSTLTSLELSFLTFLDGGSHHGFIEDLRQSSSWRARSPRPKITTNHRKDEAYRYFHAEDQVYEFLYNEGENPFSLPPSWTWTPLRWDWGLLRDPFDPEHDRPYTHDANLMRLGIIKWQDSMIETYEWLQRRKQEGKIMQILADTGAKAYTDTDAAVKYLTYGNQSWVSYDDAETFAVKIEYAEQLGLGGLMAWAVDLDDASLTALSAMSGVVSKSGVDFSLIPLEYLYPDSVYPSGNSTKYGLVNFGGSASEGSMDPSRTGFGFMLVAGDSYAVSNLKKRDGEAEPFSYPILFNDCADNYWLLQSSSASVYLSECCRTAWGFHVEAYRFVYKDHWIAVQVVPTPGFSCFLNIPVPITLSFQ